MGERRGKGGGKEREGRGEGKGRNREGICLLLNLGLATPLNYI